MSGDTAAVTLRQLMTMSGGFDEYMPVGDQWEKSAEPGENYVDLLLARPQYSPGTAFYYSDPGSHLVAAVLEAALDQAAAGRPRTVLDYARERLFDPLSISTRPALSRPFPDLFSPEFVTAGFGWATDPNGIQLGPAGLRLTAPDMITIGELCRRNGVWNGQQIVPADWLRQATAPSPLNPDYGLLWWLLGEPEGPGYMAAGAGGQQIVVLPSSRAVIVYLSEMRRDSEIAPEDLEPLNAVLAAAFP
jgi:CubicO group peptidase (beta-lactamase class C family)